MARINLRGGNLKRLTARGRIFVFTLILGAVLIPINIAYDHALPLVITAARERAVSEISLAVERCAAEFGTGNVVSFERDNDGGIRGVVCDTAALNAARSKLAAGIIDELERTAVRIPVRIGDIIGTPATAGRGASIVVKATGYNAAVADVSSGVTTSGINQTLYRVTVTVRVTGKLILPRREYVEVEYQTDVPVAETLLIGGVPGYYNGY